MNGPPASTARTFLILFESENLPFLCELPANLAWNLFQNLSELVDINIHQHSNWDPKPKTCDENLLPPI
jgi:hypothetical protein